ncbi:hypothetical protein ACFOHT_10065 [Massilia oculi]|uniref:PARP-type domain-containing protein n=1 Tax=Massilia oculi TaxID=945844 RepID=A0A2S2DHC2_9BURK|nr:hypothetical protein [Massilia oculi]AWL04266.1 hypothetical protein DIR46_07345 [Massilia oculi]
MVDLSNITHEARRQHQCAFCGLSIQTGERYVRAKAPGGGLLAKRAFHSKCYAGLSAAVAKKG